MPRFRQAKRRLLDILSGDDWLERLSEVEQAQADEMAGPLFSLLLNPDEAIRWRDITAMGVYLARLADKDMESARVVMRRFLWHMNEESGNMGWGILESMGEAMARHPRLAEEYHKLLASYVRDFECRGDCNYLDHPPLRLGAYWGLGRLAQVRPQLVAPFVTDLLDNLDKKGDPLTEEGTQARALIAWTLGLCAGAEALPALEAMFDPDAMSNPDVILGDHGQVRIFMDQTMIDTTLGEIASQAAKLIRDRQDAKPQ